jgi:protein TonB
LLILLLLTLGQGAFQPAGEPESIVSFDVNSPAPEAEETETEETEAQQPEPEVADESPADPEPLQVAPASPPRDEATAIPSPNVAILPLSREDMASADLARRPERPSTSSAPAYGPSMPNSPGDSEVVGRAPNGDPLYAARWYREPSDGELRGYLSTASGPGWALIACRTAPKWRVEDCVGLGESPRGSNLERAVLAAAWQFQVRPPRRGGETLVGSWVRIRIDYGTRDR